MSGGFNPFINNWLIDWLIEWMINWMIVRLKIDWLKIDCLNDWLIFAGHDAGISKKTVKLRPIAVIKG